MVREEKMDLKSFTTLYRPEDGFLKGLATLRGVKVGTPEFDELLAELSAFCRSYSVPVQLRDPHVILGLLDAARVQRQLPTRFWVIYVGYPGELFERVDEQGEIIVGNSYTRCAAFTDHLAARKAGEQWDTMTNERVRVAPVTNEIRSEDTFADDLERYGLTA
jgi:hypothetical protein